MKESLSSRSAFERSSQTFGDQALSGYRSVTTENTASGGNAQERAALKGLESRRAAESAHLGLFFADTYTGGSVVRANGLTIWIAPQDGSPSKVDIDQGRVVYRDAYHHTDVIHTVSTQRSEEFIHLRDATAPTSFTYVVRGLSQNVKVVQDSSGLKLDDEAGHQLLIEKPWVVDAMGTTSTAAVNLSMSDARLNGERTLELRLNPAGLSYPLMIDPTWSTTGGLATARANHTATLLPTGKVLVVGGNNARLSSCELFDPVAGTWSSTGSLARGRFSHASILLPTGKVLVIGGFDGNSPSGSSCELYDPIAGTWSSTGSLNTARFGMTAVLLSTGKVLAIGGVNGSFLASCELYDPLTGTWTATGSMSAGRQLHTATLLRSGKVLVAGGGFAGGSPTIATCEVYDPATGLWSSTGTMSAARALHSATLLNSGKVLVAGGQTNVGGSTTQFSTAEIFDPALGTWTATGSMSVAHSDHTCSLLPNGQLLIIGGGSPSTTCELFNPTTGTWANTGSLNAGRTTHTSTLLPTGVVLVTGGQSSGTPLSSTELFDPAAGAWSTPGSLVPTRYLHTASVLSSGNVLLTGGLTHSGAGGDVAIGNCVLFDPTTGGTTTTGSLFTARSNHTATVLQNGKVLVAGGQQAGPTFLASCEIYDPVAGSWSVTGSMSSSRSVHAAVLLSSGKVLVVGGGTASCELFDPSTGTWSATGSMSVSRSAHTLTVLPSGKVLANGGGTSACELYDPSTGTWSATGSMAISRSGHATVLLPTGRVLAVAGVGGVAASTTSEIYDPTLGTWSLSGSLAVGRSLFTAVSLPSGNVVAIGGVDNSSGDISGCEIFNPATNQWSILSSQLIIARHDHTAVLLPSGNIFVAGGLSNGGNGGNGVVITMEVFDPGLGFSAGSQPTISSAPVQLAPGSKLTLSGTLFTGISDGSSGGINASATNVPLVQIQSGVNGQVQWLAYDPLTPFTSTSVKTAAVAGLPQGPAWVRVFVNGIPSPAKAVNFQLGTTITWSPTGITYGTPLASSQLNAVASVPGTFVYTPAAGTVLGAGTQTLSAVFTPTDIAIAPVTVTSPISVAKATLTVTAENKSRVVGLPNPDFTTSISGLVNGESASVISGFPILTTDATSAFPVGTFAINIDTHFMSATNYTIVGVPGTLTITATSPSGNSGGGGGGGGGGCGQGSSIALLALSVLLLLRFLPTRSRRN